MAQRENGEGPASGDGIAHGRDGGDYLLRATQTLARPLADVFPFFAAAENLGRITPPELGFRIDSPLPVAMRRGAHIDYTIRLWGLPLRWRTEITGWDPPRGFEDTQVRGPYAVWVHRHRFRAVPDAAGVAGAATAIEDEVRYRLPLGPLGRLAHPVVRWQLGRIFRHRQRVVARLLAEG